MRPRRRFPLMVTALALASCGGGGDGGSSPPASAEAPAESQKTGPITLTAVTEASGIDWVHLGGSPTVDYIVESLGSGVAWLDYDLDGDPDLYLAQGATVKAPGEGPPDRLFRNDGTPRGAGVPTFTEVTEEAGLGDTWWSFGVAVGDADNDGDPDIYLTNWGPNRLYLNNGDGTFDEVSAAAGVADDAWGASAAWSDIDRDGDLDLYVANYVQFTADRYPARGDPAALGPGGCIFRGVAVYCGPLGLDPAPDVLYRNEGDRNGDGVPEFSESLAAAGLDGPAHFGLGVLFLDADDDGDDDLYVANDSVENAFFLNRGDGTFEDGGLLSGLAFNEEGRAQAGMGVDSGDYDRDGDADLAVTNFSHDHDTIYRNEGAALFTDVSYPAGIGTPSFFTLGWGIVFADFDLDGWEDLLVAHGHVYPQMDDTDLGTSYRQANSLFRNEGDGSFTDLTASAGDGLSLVKSSRGLALADMDGDGDADVVVTNLNDTPDLLRNDGHGGQWLGVRLRGHRSNRDGIGARITVEAEGATRYREMRRNHSFLSSSEPVARFGLGGAAGATRLEVRWPSGATSVLRDLPAGQVVLVEEPEE